MENEFENPIPEEPRYVKRPWWQVWGARIGLVAVIALLIMYYITVAKGGA